MDQQESVINDPTALRFPDGFLWGVATSAFQIEGNPAEINGRLSDWSVWTTRPGKIKDGTNADRACEFFQRYEDDLKLCQLLNLNAFRMSLNWAALYPAQGLEADREMLAHYRRILEAARKMGMATFVTLFHFVLPLWLAEIGGWNHQRTVDQFVAYAKCAACELGDLVDFWLTLNEPLVYTYQGYVNQYWPPGYYKNYLWGFQAIRKMLEGHARAYRAIHEAVPAAKVSFIMHWRHFVARNPLNPLDLIVRYFRDQVFNHLFPRAVTTGQLVFPFPLSAEPPIKALSGPVEALKGTMDFLAVNYYTREICEFQYAWPIDIFGRQSDVTWLDTTEMGWEIYPEGLLHLLTEDLAPYRADDSGALRPVYVTENGMAAAFDANLCEGDWSLDDDERVRFLISHLVAIHQSIQEGANVRGYLHWSLLDNFEWSDGLRCRFGLIRVAYPTQKRTLRQSARVYGEIARANAIERRWFDLLAALRSL